MACSVFLARISNVGLHAAPHSTSTPAWVAAIVEGRLVFTAATQAGGGCPVPHAIHTAWQPRSMLFAPVQSLKSIGGLAGGQQDQLRGQEQD